MAWKNYQEHRPATADVERWFSDRHNATCLICGKVSGNLEAIDFDQHGELYPAWEAQIPAELKFKLVIEQTQSGGFHVAYRCAEVVSGNTRIRIPIEFRYDNGRKRIFFPEMPDEHLKINEPLATGIARAYRWQELLDKGEYDSPEALAEALGVHTSYVRHFLRLALLAPPIVDAIFTGKAPWTLSLTKLDTTLPYSWKEQMELFGML